MQSGKLTLTKGFVDAYPEVLAKVRGSWYQHSDNNGHYFIYHSYDNAEKEMKRIQNMLGEGPTRGLYVETINSGQ